VRPSRKIQFRVPARRCLLKPPLRIKSVSTKVSEEEFAALEARARARKLTLSEWVRAELMEPREGESGAAGWIETQGVLLGEVLALRSILINLLFSVSQGEPVAESEMRGLIERADETKMQRARERMEAVRTAARATGPEPETASEMAAETNPEED
jgi:hypothetical protein